jgi:hypothetical protein
MLRKSLLPIVAMVLCVIWTNDFCNCVQHSVQSNVLKRSVICRRMCGAVMAVYYYN